MKYNKKDVKKFALGEFVGAASQLGSLIPGAGPIIGAVGGIGASIIGGLEAKKAAKIAEKKQKNLDYTTYSDQMTSQLDTVNQNPFGNQLFADGGPIPKKPLIFKRPVQPNISLPNWDGQVEKADGSIGMWGNPITNTKPVIAPTFAPPMGNIDHLGRQSGQFYQGSPATTNKIFEMEKKLKAASRYADGAEVQENQINIEKGELQIDPQSGKILREYKGVNPETGGLYEAHSKKGQDPVHNLVNADPGTFIITKAKAKQYKDAVDNNDKITKATVLQNIRNHKQEVTQKFARGADVPLVNGVGVNQLSAPMNASSAAVTPYQVSAAYTPSGVEQNKFDPTSLLGLAPGLINMFQGAKQAHKMDRVAPIINPMKNQVLNQMPDDVSLAPIKQELFNQQKNVFNQIDNSTSSSAVARANKNNVFANTSNQLGKLGIEQQMSNNQIKGQRSQLLNQLGGQDMQAQSDARQYNYNIDNTNDMKDIAKQQQMNLGISQLQELYLNNKKNKSLGAMDDKRLAALKAIFPRLADSDYAEMLSRGNK